LPDQLNSAEAFDLIDQIVELDLRGVTLSGGEPLTRKDWSNLVKCLTDRGVACNMITNGWSITNDVAKQMKKNLISTVFISIDGTKEVHDRIRKPGSYNRIEQGIKILKQESINVGAVTTLSKQNINLLPQIKDELIRMDVALWHVQLSLPVEFTHHHEYHLLDPEDIISILDFCHNTNKEGKIAISPTDCIGYYSNKELRTNPSTFNTIDHQLWDGCKAGIHSFGILYNGDIVGCTSFRNREYIEGNIRERTLRDIWEDNNHFLWRRNMSKDKLSGECGVCGYGSKCLGGCPYIRFSMDNTIYGENRYCIQNIGMKKFKEEIAKKNDTDEIFADAKNAEKNKDYQRMAMLIDRYLQLDDSNVAEVWRMKGFADFQNGNYSMSEEANIQALNINSNDINAKKCLALAIFRQGKEIEGMKLLAEVAQIGDQDAIDKLEELKYGSMYRRRKYLNY
jgi:radical SAM protein with 4Fe4S-binding SPASM domain